MTTNTNNDVRSPAELSPPLVAGGQGRSAREVRESAEAIAFLALIAVLLVSAWGMGQLIGALV